MMRHMNKAFGAMTLVCVFALPASSALAVPTSRFGSRVWGSRRKTCIRAFWLSLEAQPAHDESEVSLRILSRVTRVTPFLRIYELRFTIYARPGGRCRPGGFLKS